ncbi:hypothetical protein JNO48_05365 [Clostridiales bacterium]|nr:hypothetical protein JNO48_05365 [Clostridiales bacterium]
MVGKSANTITGHTLKENTEAENYTIAYKQGELEVTKASVEITITAGDGEQTYNGNALTNTEVTVTSGELLEGDELVATATGSATNVADTAEGNNPIAAGYKIMHGDTDVTENYVITTEAGTLTINPVEIELTADSATKECDTVALNNNTYKITKGAFVGEEGLASVTVEGDQTVVGKSANTITGHTLKENTEAENYTIAYKQGELEVTKASVEITITAGDGEQTYNGNALTNTEVTVTSGELLEGDELVATATGSATNVADTAEGNNPIAAGYKIMHGDTDVTENYVITAEAGTLTINPVEIELTADSATKEYDGTALTKNTYKITKGAFVGEEGLASVTVEGSQTVVGKSANTITGHTLKENTEAENYTIAYKQGELEVTKASVEITITAGDGEQTYNGNALTNTEVTVTSGELLEGDELVATATGSATNVADTAEGNNPIAAGYKIMHGDTDVTENYVITTEAGTLTINPVEIELTADSATKEYDGTALTKNTYKITKGAFVGEEGLASVTVEGDQTVAGKSANTITGHTLKENTEAENYTIAYKQGELEVTKASVEITITAGDGEQTYNGNALTNTEVTVTSGELLEGDELVATATGSATNVADTAEGNNPIAAGYKIMHGDTDVTENYVITTEAGTLTINPVEIELTADSATKEYDGTALTKNTYKITKGAFVGEEGLASVTVEGSQTVVGKSANTITGHTLKENTEAENYTIAYKQGELEVTKASVEITITAGDGEQTYNGNALTNTEVTVTSGELLEGDELVATATGSATNVADTAEGNNPIAAGYKIMHGDTDVTENYVITAEAGTLTINPVEIELTADSATKEYDGTALTKNTYKITKGAFVGEEGLASVTVEGSQTVVGKSANTITGHTLKENTEAENYTIAYKQGELEVTKASVEITITAGDGEQTYNGNALTNTEVTVTSGELLEGDELVATATGSATNVADTAEGNNPIAAGYKIMHGDTDVTENYVITAEAGTLTINPVEIELTADSATKEYDGTALTKNTYKITKGAFVGEEGLASVTVEGSQTVVGKSANTITGHTLKENTEAENYTIAYKQGELEVTKASVEITITAGDGEQTYNGNALTNTEVTVTSGELLEGDELVATATGSATNVADTAEGNNPIPAGYKIMHGDTDVTENYVITAEAGTLTINPVEIELTADSATKEYDGTALTKNTYKITKGAFVGEEGLASVTVEGSQTVVGKSANTITGHTLKENTEAENYTIAYKQENWK